MSDEEINNQEFFNDFKSDINNLNAHLDKINKNLDDERIEPISTGKGAGSLKRLFANKSKDEEASQALDGFIQQSLAIINKIEKFTGNFNNSWEIEKKKTSEIFENKIRREIITRKTERKDMWSLWFQKLIRWSLGAAAAVILYSTAVWAAEKCDFIKVPIKDWFPKQAQVQMPNNALQLTGQYAASLCIASQLS